MINTPLDKDDFDSLLEVFRVKNEENTFTEKFYTG